MRELCLFAMLFVCTATLQPAAGNLPAIAANDNRSSAGELRNGVLIIRLEVGEGQWHPESNAGLAIPIYAFGEAGRPLQNPGPLIRVPQGTQIQATVHNALPVGVTVHGLHERPGKEEDALTLPPGATQQVQFKAGEPGTYFYWGTTTGNAIVRREMVESQLAGAFIVDPPGAVPSDRVFVIGIWNKNLVTFDGVATINGKSWPYTERFTFKVGETVRWRWVNASAPNHAMHLHGFYYRLDAVGDAERYLPYSQAARPLVVTHMVEPGGTFDVSWVPERPGRWLYHCHMLVHMSPPERPPRGNPAPAADHAYVHGAGPDPAGMGGLVLGITVLEDKPEPKSPVWQAERKLQLIIEERKAGRPLYALELRDAAQASPPTQKTPAPLLIGPPIVLTRGQPVEIEVTNRTKDQTGIHWHGIELESYYDGVPGWTGTPQRTTPAIPPGGSFVARMTPPRAGTFIYHTHWHDRVQLENGIYGPLLVLPPGEKLDPARDMTFLFSMGTFEPFGGMLLVNGHPQPDPLRLSAGRKYRFRLINIAPNNVAMRVSLRQAGVPVQWRIIAKDGADLPPAAVAATPAEMGITVGETYDVEYEASSPQELSLEIYLPGPKQRATQALVFAPARPPKD